jgi:hypothetical protein
VAVVDEEASAEDDLTKADQEQAQVDSEENLAVAAAKEAEVVVH